VGEVRDVGFELHEHAVDAPELGQVSGGYHTENGVQIFVGKAGTVGVGAKAKEGAVIVTDPCLFCGQGPVFFQTQG
jgi:hypothetical protein